MYPRRIASLPEDPSPGNGSSPAANRSVLRLAGAGALLAGLALPASSAAVDLGLDPGPALGVTGAALAIVFGLLLRPLRRASVSEVRWGWALAATAVVGGGAVLLLWVGAFRGMPALAGGDAGDHVALSRAFVSHDAPGQHGMGAYYTLLHWLEFFLALSPLQATALVYYGSVLALVGLFAPFAAAEPHASAGRIVLWVVLLAPALAGAVLPLLHYYQADGYLPQVLVLLPLAGCALVYAAAPTLGWRAFGLLFALAAVRYTYVLNAFEVILACALTFAWDVRRRSQKPWGAAALLVAGVGLAVVALVRVMDAPGFADSDSIVIDREGPMLAGLGLLSSACLVGARAHASAGRSPLPRLAVFVGLFGLAATVVRASWKAHFGALSYYQVKHSFAPVVLTALTASLVALHVLHRWLRGGTTPRRQEFAALALVGLGIAATCVGAAPYHPSFRERLEGAPPFVHLSPLVEPGTEAVLTQRLEGARFGGFLTPRWPESSFTNASFGMPRSSWDEGDAVRMGEGRCVFWYATSELPEALAYLPAHERTVARLEAERVEPCVGIESAGGFALQLCHVCNAEMEVDVTLDLLAEAEGAPGFYDMERDGGRSWRWTDGEARLELDALPGRTCTLRVDATLPPRAGEELLVLFDGQPLARGEGGNHIIPAALEAGEHHTLVLRSTPFRVGADDPRPLSAQIFALNLRCEDR